MSLVIKSVESHDAGDYKISAVNDLGEDFDTVHLTVKGMSELVAYLGCSV